MSDKPFGNEPAGKIAIDCTFGDYNLVQSIAMPRAIRISGPLSASNLSRTNPSARPRNEPTEAIWRASGHLAGKSLHRPKP